MCGAWCVVRAACVPVVCACVTCDVHCLCVRAACMRAACIRVLLRVRGVWCVIRDVRLRVCAYVLRVAYVCCVCAACVGV